MALIQAKDLYVELSGKAILHGLTFELESGAGELYDLVNDPQEMDNLFDDDAGKSARTELTEMMQERPGVLLNEFAEPVGAA